MKKRILLLSVLALSCTTLSAAEKATETPVSNAIAIINGVTITEPEVQHFQSKLNKPVTPERALQEMINVELLAQAAKDQGMMKDEALLLELKRTATGLIASHYLQQQILKMDITAKTLKDRYQKDYVDGNQSNEYNANHILLKTEAEAIDTIQKLGNGEVFTELAKTLSTGPSGKNGGALGWFKPTDMVGPFSKATTSLTKGQYSQQPVKTQFGWHIIYLNDTRQSEPPTFESVSKKLSSTIATEEINKIMKQLHNSATLVFPKI